MTWLTESDIISWEVILENKIKFVYKDKIAVHLPNKVQGKKVLLILINITSIYPPSFAWRYTASSEFGEIDKEGFLTKSIILCFYEISELW